MTTTIHLPAPLLKRVDARAKSLGLSRNRVIVDAVEASLGSKHAWPPELVMMLDHPLDRRTARELEVSLRSVRKKRVNRRRTPNL